MAAIYNLLLLVVQLLYILIVYIYSMVTVCGKHIARKMTKQHYQQQCNNAKRITSQQQDVITCIAVQETDEQ